MNEKITLQDVIDELSDKLGVTKKMSDDFLREFFSLIQASLEKDGIAKIKGLGVFKLKLVDERKSVNVQSGEEIVIPAHYKVSFTPDKALSADVNKPYAHLETYILDEADGPVEAPSNMETFDDDDDESMLDLEELDKKSSEQETLAENANVSPSKVVSEITTAAAKATIAPQLQTDAPKEEPKPDAPNASFAASLADVVNQEVPMEQSYAQVNVIVQPAEPLFVAPEPSVTEQQPASASENEPIQPEPIKPAAPIQQSVEGSLNEPLQSVSAAPQSAEPVQPAPTVAPIQATTPISELAASDSKTAQPAEPITVKAKDQNPSVSEDKKEDEGDGDDKKKSAQSNGLRVVIILIALAIIGLLGYQYSSQLKDFFIKTNDKKPMVDTAVVKPALEESETLEQEEVPAVVENEDTVSDYDMSNETAKTEQEITTQSADETNGSNEDLSNKPVMSSKDKFHPNFVKYMKRTYPNANLEVAEILDVVKITKGKRLVDLALEYYGHKYFWVYIYFFNTEVIKNPNNLVSGTRVKIPKLDPSLVDYTNPDVVDMAFELKLNLIENR